MSRESLSQQAVFPNNRFQTYSQKVVVSLLSQQVNSSIPQGFEHSKLVETNLDLFIHAYVSSRQEKNDEPNTVES